MQMAQPAQPAPLHYVGTVLAAHNSLDAAPAHCPQPLSKTSVEDSDWEPDGVTHHVRFCEGPGTTVVWLKYGGTAGKPGGKRRKQTSTCSSWRTRSTHQGWQKSLLFCLATAPASARPCFYPSPHPLLLSHWFWSITDPLQSPIGIKAYCAYMKVR